MEIQDKCFELTNLLSIQPKNEKILNLFNQINSIYDFGKGKKGYLALAASVFIIIRQDKVPLTIGDVYKHLSQEYGPIHYKELGKMFTNIVSSLKLQLPLADFFSYFEKCMHSLPIIDKPKFISRSQALSEFGILTGLDTGRSKSSVCLAVILLVLEAESGSKPSLDLILSSCDLLSVSKRQVMTRRLEYISRLIEYGRQWPFMQDLDSKNFSVLLGSLIDWGAEREWKGMNSDLSYNPPAYKKSMSNCAETFDRISSVKRAIDQQDTADLNSKDLIIAEYLKDGYSVQEILDFNPLFRKKKRI